MNKYAELMRDGAAYARMLAELQGDSNHLKDAEKMEAAAAELEQQEPVGYGYIEHGQVFALIAESDAEGVEPLYRYPIKFDIGGNPAPVAPAVPEPEGWKLVPVKPTDEMIEAVRGRARFPRARELVDSDYRDMLSVSPELDEHDADGAEMRRDAARYRWLKKYCNFGQDLDDAADAAMREEP